MDHSPQGGTGNLRPLHSSSRPEVPHRGRQEELPLLCAGGGHHQLLPISNCLPTAACLSRTRLRLSSRRVAGSVASWRSRPSRIAMLLRRSSALQSLQTLGPGTSLTFRQRGLQRPLCRQHIAALGRVVAVQQPTHGIDGGRSPAHSPRASVKPDCTWVKHRGLLGWLLSSLVAWYCSSRSCSCKPRWPCCLLRKPLLLLMVPAAVSWCPSLLVPSSVQLWDLVLSPGLLPPVWRSLLHTRLTVWGICRQATGCEKQATAQLGASHA